MSETNSTIGKFVMRVKIVVCVFQYENESVEYNFHIPALRMLAAKATVRSHIKWKQKIDKLKKYGKPSINLLSI